MHLCLTSKKEVFCRNHKDYQTMISRIAQAAVYNDTNILAYAIMSNHAHLIVQTDREERFIRTLKLSYTRSFNSNHKHTGKIFDKSFYRLELKGIAHQQDAITYVLQNPWHHNVAENPYDYPYSSMYLYYKEYRQPLHHHVRKCKRLINRNVKLDAALEYGVNGEILPESFVEVQMVENIFGSYNAFQYLTHRKNHKEWKERQEQENISTNENAPEVTLNSIEHLLTRKEIENIENNPQYWRKKKRISDIELCHTIDSRIQKDYKIASYTQLSKANRDECLSSLLSEFSFRTSESQIKRCLGI